MKVIIAGSRTLKCVNIDEIISKSGFKITEVVSGGAKGIDNIGEEWARQHKIKVMRFIPDWKNIKVEGSVIRENSYGKYNARAGMDRNEKMGDYADAAIVIWDGKSKGSQYMADYIQELNKPLFVEMV